MSQATLERDLAPEEENSAPGGFARTALRVVLLSVVVTALVAGLYAMLGGNGSDPLAAQGTGNGTTGTTVTPAGKAGGTPGGKAGAAASAAKPLTYQEKAVALAAKLPKNAGTAERRQRLIAYSGKIGIKITAKNSPATAAEAACKFLASGMAVDTMISEFSRGSGYSKAETKAFLLGATSLYCPSQAKKFR